MTKQAIMYYIVNFVIVSVKQRQADGRSQCEVQLLQVYEEEREATLFKSREKA